MEEYDWSKIMAKDGKIERLEAEVEFLKTELDRSIQIKKLEEENAKLKNELFLLKHKTNAKCKYFFFP
jgi:hypothetical protein